MLFFLHMISIHCARGWPNLPLRAHIQPSESTDKNMAKLLASVSSEAEARIALAGEADIIDVKDPSRGALGAAAPSVVDAISRLSHKSNRVCSATTGDLPNDTQAVTQAVLGIGKTGVDFVKVGLFAQEGAQEHIRKLGTLATTHDLNLILVMFADREPDFSLLPLLARASFKGVMLDTVEKHSGGLRQCLSDAILTDFVSLARSHNLVCGLAGSLSVNDIPALLAVEPSLLGFRGALCKDNLRTDALCPHEMALVRAAIPTEPIPLCDAPAHYTLTRVARGVH